MTAKDLSRRVLIVAPIGRDAELMCTHLEASGLYCQAFATVEEVCSELKEGAGALLLTEEALLPDVTPKLAQALDCQPPWSDVPIIILAGEPSFDRPGRTFGDLGRRTNVTLIDRPVRIKSLVSAAQSALRARDRQYEIRDLMETLEDRINERDRFLAILGHELRNPLGAILLASQMKDDEGKLDGDHAELIERQSKHLTRIVNDLLDLSRLVSGKIVLKRQIIDLRDAVRQSMETVGAAAARQKVTVEVKHSDVALPVDVDPVRADQIITNVLTNAIKYTPEGGHVVVMLEREGAQAAMRVIDDGVGIAPDRIGTIFELFAQAENAIGRAQGGMGIGLALVRNLLQLHGGSITAKSDGVGRGSEFTVSFPIAIPREAMATPERRMAMAASHDGNPRRIVIVEDNADVRELLRLKLRRLGHMVDAVADGLAGVTAILDARPDLALVDIGLPGLDGYEVASQVRQSLGEEVVLVAVSGFGQPDDKRRAMEAGFDEHITKPADVTDIENLLARLPPRLASDRT
ncbi:MAG TPA: hybrid sensor histidine kinase/response regulator [Thermoanaerobaculia bacterium]|nr:hybrid sensor histidine kinase/response regulator [Thermoanaerobaculia bacterium]